MYRVRVAVISAMILISSSVIADNLSLDKKQVEKNTTTSDTNTIALVAKLNDPDIQKRVLGVARTAVLEQLQKEGISVTPEMLAQLATANTNENRDAAEILAAGAVFIATVALFSDASLKHDIVRVGVSPSGINIYEFSYNGHSSRWRGVLAQELLSTHPNAVSRDQSGYLMVDYSQIDVNFSKP